MKAVLMAVTLLLFTGSVLAQQQGEPTYGPAMRTQQGCLQGSPGHYILTTESGMTLQVVGHNELIRRHLRQEVQIQGVVGNPTVEGVGSTMTSGGGTASNASEPVIAVHHLSKVSNTCSAP